MPTHSIALRSGPSPPRTLASYVESTVTGRLSGTSGGRRVGEGCGLDERGEHVTAGRYHSHLNHCEDFTQLSARHPAPLLWASTYVFAPHPRPYSRYISHRGGTGTLERCNLDLRQFACFTTGKKNASLSLTKTVFGRLRSDLDDDKWCCSRWCHASSICVVVGCSDDGYYDASVSKNKNKPKSSP